MGIQLERECPGTDYVQVSGAVRRPQEVSHRQRGVVPVQKYVPVCKQRYHYDCRMKCGTVTISVALVFCRLSGQCRLIGERHTRILEKR